MEMFFLSAGLRLTALEQFSEIRVAKSFWSINDSVNHTGFLSFLLLDMWSIILTEPNMVLSNFSPLYYPTLSWEMVYIVETIMFPPTFL